ERRAKDADEKAADTERRAKDADEKAANAELLANEGQKKATSKQPEANELAQETKKKSTADVSKAPVQQSEAIQWADQLVLTEQFGKGEAEHLRAEAGRLRAEATRLLAEAVSLREKAKELSDERDRTKSCARERREKELPQLKSKHENEIKRAI